MAGEGTLPPVLPKIEIEQPSETPTPSEPIAPVYVAPAIQKTAVEEDDIFNKIERLAALFQKQIITETEFQSKKAELLARL